MLAEENLKKLIINYRRRLQKLRERYALEGISVDPAVLLEIEDIEARLKELHTELEHWGPEQGPLPETTVTSAGQVDEDAQKLSARQAEILRFIESFITETGVSPTIEEIRAALNISSKSVVHHHLKRIEKAGYVTRLPNKSRGIRLT